MPDRKGTGIKSVAYSVLSAAFGVQKKTNLERDFQQGRPAHYVIAGIVGTALLIVILIAIVHMVLKSV